MRIFYFKKPFFRLSTVPIAIIDEQQTEIGSIRRFFTSPLNKVLTYVFDHWGVNVRVESRDCSVSVVSKQLLTILRHKWIITSRINGVENSFLLEDKTIVKTNPQLVFQVNDTVYSMKKDFADKRVRLFDQGSGRQLANIEFESYVPNKVNKMIMTLYDTTLSPYEIACVYYLLDLCV